MQHRHNTRTQERVLHDTCCFQDARSLTLRVTSTTLPTPLSHLPHCRPLNGKGQFGLGWFQHQIQVQDSCRAPIPILPPQVSCSFDTLPWRLVCHFGDAESSRVATSPYTNHVVVEHCWGRS